MKKTLVAVLSCSLIVAGCATSAANISSSYVSPVQYQSYDCGQLASEGQRLQVRLDQLKTRLDQAAANDKAIAGVGLILFWPALFALGGTKDLEAEYARLKGEYSAVEQATIARKCTGTVAAKE